MRVSSKSNQGKEKEEEEDYSLLPPNAQAQFLALLVPIGTALLTAEFSPIDQ